MTIAIGILTKNYVTIAADSQETSGAFMKTDAAKVHSFQHPKGGALVLSGAGHAGYIDAIAEQIGEWFLKTPQLDTTETYRGLGTVLKEFYADHVVPFSAYPTNDRPDFSLVIGFQRHKGKPQLVVSDANTLRKRHNFAAIGVGQFQAVSLLHQFHSPVLSLQVAERLAAYLAYRVKDTVDGCGRLTFVVSIRDGQSVEVHPEIIRREWESLFLEFDETDAAVLHYALGGTGTLERVSSFIAAFREDFDRATSPSHHDHTETSTVSPPPPGSSEGSDES